MLTTMSTLVFTIQPTKGWAGTVYIRADGRIDPSDAPVSTSDYVRYTLTDNITSSDYGIIIERDDIIVDGNGYTLQGSKFRAGFLLSEIDNVTIKNTNVKGFISGIWLQQSSNNRIFRNNITANKNDGIWLMTFCSNNTISENNITANNQTGIHIYFSSNNVIDRNNVGSTPMEGISVWSSSNNTISRNNITDNGIGVSFYSFSSNYSSSGNRFRHNNFINNTGWQAYNCGPSNAWDNDYPSGGNYWSDYSDKFPSVKDQYRGENQDTPGSDGIWDDPYPIGCVIASADLDRYPLVNPRDNVPPIANAGPDQIAKEDALLTFDGSASSDNIAIKAYAWTFTDIIVRTLTGEKPVYTFDTPGVYTITLNVTDEVGNWATDTVTVTVLPIESPPPIEAFLIWIIAAAIGTMAIAALAVILFKRRKQTR